MKIFVTERLAMRPIHDEDIPLITSLLCDEGRNHYLFAGTAMTPDKALALVRQYFTGEEETAGMGALIIIRTGKLAGFAGLIPTNCLGAGDFELGFALFAWAEGNNYPAEIGLAQMQCAFNDLDKPRVLALAHPENAASIHILRDKLQMQEVSRWPGDAHRGPRIVFCRARNDGLPTLKKTG